MIHQHLPELHAGDTLCIEIRDGDIFALNQTTGEESTVEDECADFGPMVRLGKFLRHKLPNLNSVEFRLDFRGAYGQNGARLYFLSVAIRDGHTTFGEEATAELLQMKELRFHIAHRVYQMMQGTAFA